MHVVGIRWHPAALQVADAAGEVSSLPLEGSFAWTIGEERVCTGHHDGAWRPCPDQRVVGREGQCLACFRGRGDAARANDDPACVFEPRCMRDGVPCTCSYGAAAAPVPHVVYLAFYGILPKVGMTKAARVAARLNEQGADAYLIVQRCADRATARLTERAVARLHGIPEWRTHRETLPQLARPVPWEAMEARAARWAEDLGRHFAPETQLHRIDHALPQPLEGRPRRVPAEGPHSGTWVGAKGQHLVYREAPRSGVLDVGASPLAVLKGGDLLGRTVWPSG